MLDPASSLRTGTPYQMGYAHGELMTEKAQGMISDVWTYLEEQVVRLGLRIGLLSFVPRPCLLVCISEHKPKTLTFRNTHNAYKMGGDQCSLLYYFVNLSNVLLFRRKPSMVPYPSFHNGS